MAVIKKYTKKDGSTAYKFNAYLGINEKTGNKKRTTRQGFPTKKEAKLALARLEAGVDKPKERTEIKQPTVVNPTTFKEVFKSWFVQYKNTVKKITAQSVKNIFNSQILPKFGKLKISDVTFDYCQETVNIWAEYYVGYANLKAYTAKVFQYAVKRKWLNENPFDDVELPKREETPQDELELFYSRDELIAFLDYYEENFDLSDYLLLRVLAYTGMRKSEVLALTWSDISFTNQSVRINRNVVRADGEVYLSNLKTRNSKRVISVDEKTLSLLDYWKTEQLINLKLNNQQVKFDKEQYIFPDRYNQVYYPEYPNTIMKKYTGKRIKVHGLRHTHASLLFEAGATIKEVQMRLGHANIKTTMEIYAHVTRQAEQDVPKKFLEYMTSEEKGIKKGIKLLKTP